MELYEELLSSNKARLDEVRPVLCLYMYSVTADRRIRSIWIFIHGLWMINQGMCD